MTIQSDLVDVAANAKLTQEELAKAFGLSRVMISRYMRGHTTTFRYKTIPVLVKTLATLNGLVADKKLPLPDSYTKEKRLAAMEKIKQFVASVSASAA